MKPSVLATGLLTVVLFTGCAGYQLGAPKPKRLVGVQTIAVPTTKNDTLKPRVEVLAASTIIKQIQQDGTYRVVSADNADAVLETTIKRIERTPSRSVRNDVRATREFRLRVEIGYVLRSASTGETLAAGTATGDTSFFVGSDVNEEERVGIPRALEQAAVRLVSEISEGW